MKKTNDTLRADLLKGDAPGAAPVTVTVDGRTLTVPRCVIIGLMTLAANRSAEKLQAALNVRLGEVKNSMENALEEIRFWEADALRPAGDIIEFLRSKS